MAGTTGLEPAALCRPVTRRLIGLEGRNPLPTSKLLRSPLLGSRCYNSDILPKLALVHSFFSSCGGLRFLRMDSPRISMRWAL